MRGHRDATKQFIYIVLLKSCILGDQAYMQKQNSELTRQCYNYRHILILRSGCAYVRAHACVSESIILV